MQFNEEFPELLCPLSYIALMLKPILTSLILITVYPFIWLVRASQADESVQHIRFRFYAELLSLAPFQLGMLMRRLFMSVPSHPVEKALWFFSGPCS